MANLIVRLSTDISCSILTNPSCLDERGRDVFFNITLFFQFIQIIWSPPYLFYCRMIEPVEFLGRPHMLGLGATPKPKEPPKKRRIKKPGEEEKKVSAMQPTSGLVMFATMATGSRSVHWQRWQSEACEEYRRSHTRATSSRCELSCREMKLAVLLPFFLQDLWWGILLLCWSVLMKVCMDR